MSLKAGFSEKQAGALSEAIGSILPKQIARTAHYERSLEEVDFEPPQARAVTEVIQGVVSDSDRELRAWMAERFFTKEDAARMEARIQVQIAEVKADIMKWMFLFWVGQFAAMIVILVLRK